MATKKKAAMVQPRPAIVSSDQQLAGILQMFGNTRPYVIISSHHNHWLIHFEGDYDHTVVKIIDGKPNLIKEGEKS